MEVKTLNEDPLIYEIDGFLSAEELEHFISFRSEEMTRAQVAGVESGKESKRRTNSVRWLQHKTTDLTWEVAQRAAQVVGMPVSHAESFQLIQYLPGQEYQIHFDAFDARQARGRRNWLRGGQRMITMLVYLNDVEAGGVTEFPSWTSPPGPGPARRWCSTTATPAPPPATPGPCTPAGPSSAERS